MKQIAILGECMIELNGKPFAKMQQTFGGDTLNAAIYLSRASELNTSEPIQISYVSALGVDAISQGMLERWQQEGIDTDMVLRDNQRTPGLYLIQLDEHGERTFLYWRSDSPARYLLQHPDVARISKKLASVDMLFLSGISLAILPENDKQALLDLLKTLKSKGVEIAFDSNFRPALWPKDGNQSVKNFYQQMYQLTDLALVTFDDEQQIWGDNTPEQTIDRLVSLGVNTCIVKLGKDGCLAFDKQAGKTEHIQTKAVENVVDTTSAGDSFNGGFLSAYLAGEKLRAACERGNKLAGLVIQHQGAIIAKAITEKALKNSI